MHWPRIAGTGCCDDFSLIDCYYVVIAITTLQQSNVVQRQLLLSNNDLGLHVQIAVFIDNPN